MEWIFLSPHFDDVAYSCGGMIRELVDRGDRVTLLTIFAGNPDPGDLTPFAQQIHARWGSGYDAVELRRQEDLRACARLGAIPLHFDLPDCIYRRLPADGAHLVRSEADLFQPPHEGEAGLMLRLAERLKNEIPVDHRVVCPLGIGGHIDHRLARQSAQQACDRLWFYADYPYIGTQAVSLADWVSDSPPPFHQEISAGGLRAWQDACAAYASQISSFWEDGNDMRASLEAYWREGGGSRLWQAVPRMT